MNIQGYHAAELVRSPKHPHIPTKLHQWGGKHAIKIFGKKSWILLAGVPAKAQHDMDVIVRLDIM